MAHSIPASVCPVCQTVMDRTQGIENYRSTRSHAKPGDIALCRCGTALKFKRGLTLAALDPTELVELALDQPEFYQQIMEIRQFLSQQPQ